MPEDRETNNGKEIQRADANNPSGGFQRRFSPQNEANFESVLKKIEEEMGKDAESRLNPDSPIFRAGENAARNLAKENRQKYIERRNAFNQAAISFQNPQNFPRAAAAGVAEEENEETLRARKQAEIEEKVQEEIKEDLTEKQKLAVKIAGDRALRILQGVAEEMAERAEAGGIMGEIIILFTFVLSIAKDLADFLLATVAISSLPIPVLDIAVPISTKLISWMIGFIASTILTFFWMNVSENWKGGVATNWIMRVILRFMAGWLIEGAVSILPVYTVLNAWCYYDYRNEQRDAAEEGERVGYEAERVKSKVNADLRDIDAAL